MSAFVVSHKHINTLLSYANRQRNPLHFYLSGEVVLRADQVDDLQRAAEILLAENYRSVYARYPDTRHNPSKIPGLVAEAGKDITFNFVLGDVSAVQILKACQCYDYQACETEDYDQSDAKRIIDRLQSEAIHRLSGYEEAKWEIL